MRCGAVVTGYREPEGADRCDEVGHDWSAEGDVECRRCGYPRECDAYVPAEAPAGCRNLATGLCPTCDEALCTRHLAWHRAESNR